MSQRDPRQYVDRRRKKDWVTRAIPILSSISWIAALAILIFLDRASPDRANFFTRLAGTMVYSTWNTQMLRIALIILVVVFIICLIGIIFNALRHRRKTDKFNIPIIIMEIVSGVGIVVFLVNFGSHIF